MFSKGERSHVAASLEPYLTRDFQAPVVEIPDVGSLPLFPVLPVFLLLLLLLPNSVCEVRGAHGPWWAAQTWTYPLL